MSLQHANLASNFAARIFVGLSSFICIPFILKFIGVESYGLMGFFNLMSTFLTLLDFGFTGALNREVAAFSASQNTPKELRNLVKTLEILFWGLGLIIGCVLLLSVGVIAQNWITSSTLSPTLIHHVLLLMSISLVSQWPFTIYSNILMGLEKQVLNNTLIILFTACRHFGGLLVLWLVSANIETYFIYQIGVNLLQTVVGRIVAWRKLPPSQEKPSFDRTQLKRIKGYAAGMSLVSLLSFFMIHIDKIILSKILHLDSFGYYLLASNLASMLYVIISPIFATYFPRLTHLAVLKNKEELAHTYHESCQIMSTLLLPAALTIFFFSPEILYAWTQSADVTQKSYDIVRYLVLGTALNGLMNMPYAIQLAHGITRYTIFQNIISIIVLIPCTLWMASVYGAKGAATTWVVHNVGCILIMGPFFHYKFLKGEFRKWSLYDIGLPLLVSAAVIIIGRWSLPTFSNIYTTIFWISVMGLAALLACQMALPSSFQIINFGKKRNRLSRD